MIEIGRENQFYGFAHEGMQACCTARDGDVLRFHTQDCYGDLLTREDIRRADIGDRAPKFNPTTGPVYIEGANPGDTLAVEILDIVPGARGAMRLTPGVGGLADAVEREHAGISLCDLPQLHNLIRQDASLLSGSSRRANSGVVPRPPQSGRGLLSVI